MKLCTLVILVLSLTNIFAHAESIVDISSLKRKYRIIVVWEDPKAIEVQNQLIREESFIDDRQIAWFIITDNGVRTNFATGVTQSFKDNVAALRPDNGNVVLVGKDGSVKHAAKQLDLKEIFDLIDLMPMRREEIRAKN